MLAEAPLAAGTIIVDVAHPADTTPALRARADLTIIDPDLSWTIRAEELHSRSKNTPFDGRRVTGRAIVTNVAGELKHSLEPAHR